MWCLKICARFFSFLTLAFSWWAKHTGAGSTIQHTETTAVPPGQHWFPIQNSVDLIERAQDSVSWAPACATLQQRLPGWHYHILSAFVSACELSFESTRESWGACVFRSMQHRLETIYSLASWGRRWTSKLWDDAVEMLGHCKQSLCERNRSRFKYLRKWACRHD